jgi:hypothetical protein
MFSNLEILLTIGEADGWAINDKSLGWNKVFPLPNAFHSY